MPSSGCSTVRAGDPSCDTRTSDIAPESRQSTTDLEDTSLVPGDGAEGFTQKINVVHAESGDSCDTRFRHDVGGTVSTTGPHFKDGDIDLPQNLIYFL
jgi:hypothetical protein